MGREDQEHLIDVIDDNFTDNANCSNCARPEADRLDRCPVGSAGTSATTKAQEDEPQSGSSLGSRVVCSLARRQTKQFLCPHLP
jgi:hypothetical protein